MNRSLTIKPSDLTMLRKNINGVFPTEKVIATIDGRSRIDAHGESKMPVWGELFDKAAMPQKNPAATAAKVKLIAEYVATLQR